MLNSPVKLVVALDQLWPGATGIHDAREDGVPVLAIIGKCSKKEMNMDGFQE